MKKKKILLMTDFSLTSSGFGRFAKSLLEYLYKLDKYELIHLSVGMVEGDPNLQKTPWKSIGTVNAQKLQEIKKNQDPRNWEQIDRLAGYGVYALDEIVRSEKPDAVFLVQDIWGINFGINFEWSKKIPTVFWTTLDSRPILQQAIDVAKNSTHFWSWADFATKDMHKIGLTHVKTVPGCIDTTKFYPLSEKERVQIRQKIGIKPTDFIIGMVGRNQLRKGFPNIIEGYSIFKKENPEIKNTKLFFHTSWAEGWPLHKYCEQFGVPKDELLTTYVCPICKNYEIKQFTGHNLDCRFCGTKGAQPNANMPHGNGQLTTHPSFGTTEKQLNEIYNILDLYLHAFTSGGLEIPIIENMLAASALCSITNYSCGEDYCNDPESGVSSLDWDKYVEGTGTDFIKAWTKPYSIAKSIKKFYNLDKKEKEQILKKSRNWALNKFSPQVIGGIVENLVDLSPFSEADFFESKPLKKNPNYIPSENPNISEWLKEIYNNFFGREPDAQGFNDWKKMLEAGKPRNEIINIFRQVATKEEAEQKKFDFADFLDKKDKGRVLVVLPQSLGDIFLTTSLFKSIKNRYPDWSIYFCANPENFSILQGNPYIHKLIPYTPMMDNHLWLTGNRDNNGYFDIVFHPSSLTQKLFNYYNNNNNDVELDLLYKN